MRESRDLRLAHRIGNWCLLCCLVVLLDSCKKQCRDVDTIYDVYYQAFVFPERFDQYYQENRGRFDQDFLSCLDELIEKADELIRASEQHCDEVFVEGSDFWNKCYDEISGQYGAAAVLQTIRDVVRNNVIFSQTQTGQALILSKQIIGAADYEYVLNSVIPRVRESLKCRFCEEKFFLL